MHKPASRWQRKSLFLLGNGVSHQKLKMPHMLQDMLQHVLSILRQDEISQENFFCLRESDHVPKMRGNKDFKTYAFFPQKDWPRQDSNLQSPVPKSGALSIRPHGRGWGKERVCMSLDGSLQDMLQSCLCLVAPYQLKLHHTFSGTLDPEYIGGLAFWVGSSRSVVLW